MANIHDHHPRHVRPHDPWMGAQIVRHALIWPNWIANLTLWIMSQVSKNKKEGKTIKWRKNIVRKGLVPFFTRRFPILYSRCLLFLYYRFHCFWHFFFSPIYDGHNSLSCLSSSDFRYSTSLFSPFFLSVCLYQCHNRISNLFLFKFWLHRLINNFVQ